MASRYVGQLGRYVGQSRYELARNAGQSGGYPQSPEVAMCTPF